MKNFLFILICMSAVLVQSCLGSSRPAVLPEVPPAESVQNLIKRMQKTAGKEAQNRLFKRWLDRRGGKPLPVVDGKRVTFVFYSSVMDERISLSCAANRFSSKSDYFNHVAGTGLYWLAVIMERPDGKAYRLYTHKGKKIRWKKDPLNPRISVLRSGMSQVRTAESGRGSVCMVPDFQAEKGSLTPPRDIFIYLPPGYYKNPSRRYPVIYFQDGQNLWDSSRAAWGGWKVDTTLDRMINAQKIKPVIAVGIPCSSRRAKEYVGFSTWYKEKAKFKLIKQRRAQRYNTDYVSYLVDRLKPYLEKNFRIKKGRRNTAIVGSSFGAGISLYIGIRYPQQFSMIGAFSGGNWMPDSNLYQRFPYQSYPYLIDRVIKRKKVVRIWLDCGTIDLDAVFLPRTREMYTHLKRLGWKTDGDLRYREARSRGHNERAWAERLPQMLQYFFSK